MTYTVFPVTVALTLNAVAFTTPTWAAMALSSIAGWDDRVSLGNSCRVTLKDCTLVDRARIRRRRRLAATTVQVAVLSEQYAWLSASRRVPSAKTVDAATSRFRVCSTVTITSILSRMAAATPAATVPGVRSAPVAPGNNRAVVTVTERGGKGGGGEGG